MVLYAMSYEMDKITRGDVSLVLSVLLFSFLMGLLIGEDSLGITLFIGVTVYIAVYVVKVMRLF